MSKPLSQPRASFGSFEVNPSTGELHKQGIRIKLHEKSLQVLLTPLEHPNAGIPHQVLVNAVTGKVPILDST